MLTPHLWWKREIVYMSIYRSLAKERLTSLPKRRVGTVLSVSTINHERASMCIYRNSLPTNSLNVWTKTNIQLSYRPWKLTFWQHATLWTAKCHHEDGVASEHGPLAGYDAKPPFPEVLTPWVGAHWPYTGNWPKSRGWELFCKTTVYVWYVYMDFCSICAQWNIYICTATI